MQICHVILFSLTLSSSLLAYTQQTKRFDLYELATKNKLQVVNRNLSTFSESDKKGVTLDAAEKDGLAWIEGVTFSDGIIELDIKGRDVLQQSFVGIAFHGRDDSQFDAIYFRPFNFRATDSVRKIHAVQYISLPVYDWKKLRDEQNGRYEKAIDPAPSPDEWFHAKIVITFPSVKVYVNGNDEPSLSVEQLSTQKTGKLGLWVGNNSDGSFSNLTVRNLDKK